MNYCPNNAIALNGRTEIRRTNFFHGVQKSKNENDWVKKAVQKAAVAKKFFLYLTYKSINYVLFLDECAMLKAGNVNREVDVRKA